MKRFALLLVILFALLVLPQTVFAGDGDLPHPQPTESPLLAPVTGSGGVEDALSQTLGTLAVYAAFMAALAVGVEVITDLVRPIFGLERQLQAMETLSNLRDWLPGTLKEMNVDPQAQARLEGFLGDLEKTVTDVTDYTRPERLAQEVQRWALYAVKSAGGALAEQVDAQMRELVGVLLQQSGLAVALDRATQTFRALAQETFQLDRKGLDALIDRLHALGPYFQQQAQAHIAANDTLDAAIETAFRETLQRLAAEMQLPEAEMLALAGRVKSAFLAALSIQESQVTQILTASRGFLSTLQGGSQLSAQLQSLREVLHALQLDNTQIDQVVAKAMELSGVLSDAAQLQQKKAELAQLLIGFGVDSSKVDEVLEIAVGIMRVLKQAEEGKDIVTLAASLSSFGGLLDEVERQRYTTAGYVRRVWRTVRDWRGFGLTRRISFLQGRRWSWARERSTFGALLYLLERGWNMLWGKGQPGGSLAVVLTPDKAAQVLLERDRVHHQQEVMRQRQLRLITVFVGMVLAVLLRVDSLELLRPLFGATMPGALFNTATGDTRSLQYIIEIGLFKREGLTWQLDQLTGLGKFLFSWIAVATPGMLLSGLAASGGSAFWHDQLDRLRAAKQTTEQLSSVVAGLKSGES